MFWTIWLGSFMFISFHETMDGRVISFDGVRLDGLVATIFALRFIYFQDITYLIISFNNWNVLMS